MKTLAGFFSLSSLLLIASLATGCALADGSTSTEEEESVSTAATTNGDDGPRSSVGDHELAQPIAPNRGNINDCTNCGPGPQPWQNTLNVTSEAR